MPKLFLVGITPDHRALVLSEHARAKRGDMVLEIDDRLLEAIDKAQRLRAFDEGHRLESAALPSKRDTVNGDGTDVARLSPREIQQRLRAGETITALARSSGTDEAWIRRFAAPVLAEQSKVIEQARGITLTKRGVGPSAVTLGPAVAANVIDRGVPLTLPELEAGWGAYQRPEGGWHVRFTFPLRGRRQTAEWEIDLATGELTARNKLASELGWRESGKKLPQPKPAKVAPPRPADVATGRTAPAPAPAADKAEAEPAQVLPLTDGEPTDEPTGTTETAGTASRPAAIAGTSESTGTAGSGGTAGSTGRAESAGTAEPTGTAGSAGTAEPAGTAESTGTTAAAGTSESAGTAESTGARGSAGKAASGRKLPAVARKAPAARTSARKPAAATAKRTAAAVTEAPAQSVVPVPPAEAGPGETPDPAPERPAGSMPPTDLDVVDVPGGFPLHDDEDDDLETVIVLPPSDDEIPAPPEAADDGPISMVARPQPAPLGARPAPRGGPPAL